MTQQQQIERHEVLTMAYQEYEKKLISHAYFKIGDRGTSEALVQDTFMKTWNYLVKGGKIEVMKAFLYHVLNNLIVDEYRKQKTTSLDALFEKGFDPSTDRADRLFDRIDGEGAMRLISKLPAMYQTVMRMRYVEDLSLEEMSLITGLSKNTLAVQLHRGLEKLKLLYHHV